MQRRNDLRVMTADVLAFDVQIVVAGTADDETTQRQWVLADGPSLKRNQYTAQHDAPLFRGLRRQRLQAY